jgi:hypothetical protein
MIWPKINADFGVRRMGRDLFDGEPAHSGWDARERAFSIPERPLHGFFVFANERNGALTKPQARTRQHAGLVSKGLGEQLA